MSAHTWRTLGAVLFVFVLAACFPEDDPAPEESAAPIRGVITTLIEQAEEVTIRRYPGVLEPSDVNPLSFEVGGRIGRVTLDVGERVSEGQLLAELEPEQFLTAIENRRAQVEEAEATLSLSEDDLERSETLLERGVVSVVQRDEDLTTVRQNRAQLTQAEKDLALAEEDLADSKLYAPFGGIVDSIEIVSFETVSSGQTVLSLYQQENYEVSFSVSFDVVSRLVVGTPATVRLADDPSIALSGVISELGERAGTVSSFPVVVSLTETVDIIKPGMAVEVALEFPLQAVSGHLLPMSAVIPGTEIPEGTDTTRPVDVDVYVFDPPTGTVKRHTITMGGVRENQFLIISGLNAGDRVATKGVAFLRDGMEVNLVQTGEDN